MNLDEAEIQCPHCGETLAVPIDPSQGMDQAFIEDCSVCCRPIVFRVRLSSDSEQEAVVSAEKS